MPEEWVLGRGAGSSAALPARQFFLSLTPLSIRIVFAATGDVYNMELQAFNPIFVSSPILLLNKNFFFQTQIF